MKIAFRIYDNERHGYVKVPDFLMKLSGQDPAMGFEDIAVQSDGTVIICDKCGNFGYLDSNRYELKIMTETS